MCQRKNKFRSWTYGIEKDIVLTLVQVSVQITLKMKHRNSFVDIFNGFHYENMFLFEIQKKKMYSTFRISRNDNIYYWKIWF